jgi:hypothetical protein
MIPMRFLLLFILAVTLAPLAAQDFQPFTRFYTGTIGPWDFRLTVEIAVDRVHGRLRSNGVPAPLLVEGAGPKQDRIDCLVTDGQERPIGRLMGRLTEQRGIQGRFKPNDGGAELEVVANESAEYLRSDRVQGPWFRLTSALPVFVESTPMAQKINLLLGAEIQRLELEFLGMPAARRLALTPMRQDCDVEILHASPRLISTLVTHYTFTGGAHGTTDYLPLTWTWLDGAPFRMDLPDLFTDPAAALTAIKAACAEDLASQGASEAKLLAGKPAEFFHNFALSRSGLMLAFAPYAVGAYGEGAYAVTIPWAKLAPWIDTKGALADVLPTDLIAPQPAPKKPTPKATPKTSAAPSATPNATAPAVVTETTKPTETAADVITPAAAASTETATSTETTATDTAPVVPTVKTETPTTDAAKPTFPAPGDKPASDSSKKKKKRRAATYPDDNLP